MSNTTNRQNKKTKLLVVSVVLFFIVFIALLATGCSVPSTAPDPSASSASTPSEEPAAEAPKVPVFGEVVSYEDGLSISVSEPAPYAPSEMAAGVVDGQQVIIFTFVLTNNSTEAFDPALILASASSAGTEASGVFDTSNNVGFPPTTSVLPGGTIQWNQAFSVADPADVIVEATVGFTHDPAIFTSAK